MRTISWIGSVLMVILMGAGCVQHQTALERNWGKSYETARTRQILNPEAGASGTPVEGLSGQAVENSMDRYEKGFEKAAAQDRVVNILFQ